MDSFESNPLRGWRLETGYDANGDRLHQRPSGSERWRAVRCLGKGSFGDIWQEHCISGPSKDAIRAVKRLSKRQSTFSEMSRRELNALVTFSNSHIPEVQQAERALGQVPDKTGRLTKLSIETILSNALAGSMT